MNRRTVECKVEEAEGVTWLRIGGRIDSLSADEVGRALNGIIDSGGHRVVADLSDVGFVSSAGLRVFLVGQKQLKALGGELVLYHLSPGVLQVFKMGGFDRLFRMVSTMEALAAVGVRGMNDALSEREELLSGIPVRVMHKACSPGRFGVIGSQAGMGNSSYTETDVVPVLQKDIQYGVGLAAIGNRFQDYADYFGEAVVVNHSIYVLPAIKRAAVDFLLCAASPSEIVYPFLHGFAFSGEFQTIVAFDSIDTGLSLDMLVKLAFEATDVDRCGLVFFAESAGILGMHLKKVPWLKNQPPSGKEIFSSENFAEWMNFPVEPTHHQKTILAAGVAVRDAECSGGVLSSVLAQGRRHHMHGGIFARGPLSREVNRFATEFQRILAEFEVQGVAHLLGESRFGPGMMGIIPLDASA